MDDFAADLENLNKTWAAFVKAKSELNKTAAQKSWLTETGPDSGVFTFSLAGLAKLRSKVLEVGWQKNKYLAQRTELRQRMMEAVYNNFFAYFQVEEGTISGDDTERLNPFIVIQRLFGLVNEEIGAVEEDNGDEEDTKAGGVEYIVSDIHDDGTVEEVQAAGVSGDSIIESILAPPLAESNSSGEHYIVQHKQSITIKIIHIDTTTTTRRHKQTKSSQILCRLSR